MEEDEWESEEEEEAEDHSDDEDSDQRIKSVSFQTNSQSLISTNSPFRLSNFPRVPPYYRCRAICWRDLILLYISVFLFSHLRFA